MAALLFEFFGESTAIYELPPIRRTPTFRVIHETLPGAAGGGELEAASIFFPMQQEIVQSTLVPSTLIITSNIVKLKNKIQKQKRKLGLQGYVNKIVNIKV